MKLYICEICGDAYIGEERPSDCPFCGAKSNFIKLGTEARPITEMKEGLSEISKRNLEETLRLEIKANATYLCMAEKTKDYAIMKMYKRIAKVELEHAIIAIKLLGIAMPEIKRENCFDSDDENFKETIKLEDDAVELYKKFARESQEEHLRKFFGAIAQAEKGHSDLIKNLMN